MRMIHDSTYENRIHEDDSRFDIVIEAQDTAREEGFSRCRLPTTKPSMPFISDISCNASEGPATSVCIFESLCAFYVATRRSLEEFL